MAVALSLSAVSPVYAAEQDTLQVIIPWEAEGRVFQVDTSTIMFLGAVKGVMYVESSRGEMHEAFVMCPLVQKLSLETATTEGVAHCEITASSENVAYAEITCGGEVGNCNGTFTLIDGEGKFAGISGTGALRIRSPMHALISDMAAGAVIRVSSGLMVVKDLDYRIP
ncbi:MAG: hypothetical protein ACO20Y_07825 [Poseidonia sp.]